MISYSMYSNEGSRRNNEDSIGVGKADNTYGFIVADGLGGHGMGEIASKMAVDTGIECVKLCNGDISKYIEMLFENTQSRLLRLQSEKNLENYMKTTAVVLAINEKKIVWGHIGDSRLYYIKGNRIKKRTLDHSYVQNLCLSHQIKESQIRNHPDRNVLLKVLGSEWGESKYELSKEYRIKKNQSFLLCTDGFWELIEDEQIVSCLKDAATVDEWMDMMVKIIKTNGVGKDMDNYSAIAVWVR